MSIQTARYVTARPLDRFAKNFLQFLDDWFYINDNISLQTVKYLSNVKVYACTDKFWNWLLDLREAKMWNGDTGEYASAPPRNTIDALSIGPVAVDKNTGRRYLIPREDREYWHKSTFPTQLAHQFAEYDALIFLYHPERWAQQLSPAMFPQVTRAQFDDAKTHLIKHAPFRAVAHELLHLVQKITGGDMPRWDPTSDIDPVEPLYDDYADQLTLPVFDTLYLPPDGEPAAEPIDI